MKRFFVIFLLSLMMLSLAVVMAEAVEVTPVPELPVIVAQPFFSLTGIVVAIIGAIGAVFTIYLIPWIKSRTSINQQAMISTVITMLVYAAEQMYQGAERGREKMEYVKAELEKRGVTIDIAEIEAAVMKLNMEEWMAAAALGPEGDVPTEPKPEPLDPALHGGLANSIE